MGARMQPTTSKADISRAKRTTWRVSSASADLLNLALFARGARIVPAPAASAEKGLKLSRVSAKGVFPLLGFKRGDIVQSVNGQLFGSARDVIKALRENEGARRIVVRLSRGGKTRTQTYVIEVATK
jgi:S1-C subfamily serine protease